MKRLELGNLQIAKNKISYLEVYCTKNAKKVLEGDSDLTEELNLFDKMTTIRIRTENNKELRARLLLLDVLIERTEFYGIKRELFTSVEEDFLPLKLIAGVFYNVVADNLGHPNIKMKSVWYSGLEGLEHSLETKPKIVLELTQKVRDSLPEEVVKQVNSYFQIPA